MSRDEAIQYARVLSDLGDVVERTSKAMPQDVPTEIDAIKLVHEAVNDTLQIYSKCLDDLKSVIVPTEISGEHVELADAFQGFVNGTRFIYESIIVSTHPEADTAATVDSHMYSEGLIAQREAQIKTMKIVSRITSKLNI